MAGIFLLFAPSVSLKAQTLQVLDRATSAPVPYASVWIDGAVGTTTDEKGRFRLPQNGRDLVITSVGYQPGTFSVGAVSSDTLFLEARTIELSEVEVRSAATRRKNVTLGSAAKSDRELSVIPPYTNRAIGRKFGGSPHWTGLPIASVRFRTFNDRDGAVLNVQLFRLDEHGNIGEPLVLENIVVETRSGNNRMASVDLKPYRLIYPEHGLMVVLENLLLERNALTLDDGVTQAVIYEPRIKVRSDRAAADTFYFNGTEWKANTGLTLLVELTLGDSP